MPERACDEGAPLLGLGHVRPEAKPFDASFGASARYRQPRGEESRVQVVVDGTVCPGRILGRNGPRAQVRFAREGATYVRWFDAAALLDR